MNRSGVVTQTALEGLVFPQANSALPVDVLQMVADLVGGISVCDRPGFKLARALRWAGYRGPLVVDLLDAAWRSTDSHAERGRVWHGALDLPDDVTLVTPSRRIPPGDAFELTEQLAEARGYTDRVDTFALTGLALDHRWLRQQDASDMLHEHIRTLDGPVAIAFACTHDPFATRDAVLALQHILGAGDVALMRSDLAAAGAVAYGGLFGAIGLTSSVRHLPIPMRRAPGVSPQPGNHVLVPEAFTWVEATRIWRAGEHPDLVCACDAHPQGEWLGRYRDPAYKQEALLHAFYTWLPLAERLRATRSDELKLEWGTTCRQAWEAQQRLETATGVSFSKQPLRWWTSL